MMAALPPTEILSEDHVGAKASTQRADEASIEVIHNAFPALDFSSLPLEEGKAPGADINNSEWDPHRVYFNEFLAGDPSNATTRAAGGDSNLQFSPFGVGGLDDEDFDSTRASVQAKPSAAWAKPQWTFRRNEDEAAPKDEGGDCVDETLDPLGWPRQPSLLLVEAKKDGEEGVDVADEGMDIFDGDDEDLLGPGLRAGRSDGDDAGVSVSDTAALAHHHEIEDKVHRLEQYAAVEPDEASVANSSHSSEPNQSDDDEDEEIEVEYQTQEDDGDDASDQEDLRDEFQDLVLHMAQQEKSDYIIDHGTEATQIEFAALDPESESAPATPPAFEVTWEGAAPAECRVDKTGSTGTPPGEEIAKDVVRGMERKPAPLLKPPSEEKIRKWLAGKDKS